ncbi:MAG: GNAT family N-acetyltransferase [Caldilineaceae bacterium]|nr:GNAT family N-acetyltransferase [Caldilineaceae bacterium]
MYQKLDVVTLRSGEQVEVGVVQGPDSAWAERLVKLLWHKGDPWNWQNAQVLERDLGLDVFFYILHRAGQPLANIMTIERAGVGLFGHVWTEPADRQKGASSLLMAAQMEHFEERGGQALFLGTGYDSVAYRMYARFGFTSVEAQSGYMAYYRAGQVAFEQAYFGLPTAATDVVIQPLHWVHWPAAAALFLGDFPGVIRNVHAQIFGRQSPEGGLLPLLLEGEVRQRQGKAPVTLVLQNQVSSAVVGLASLQEHPLWPDLSLLDLYYHPAYTAHLPAMLDALPLAEATGIVAYADAAQPAKQQLLQEAGFQVITTLPAWVAADPSHSRLVDVIVYRR